MGGKKILWTFGTVSIVRSTFDRDVHSVPRVRRSFPADLRPVLVRTSADGPFRGECLGKFFLAPLREAARDTWTLCVGGL